MNKKNYKEAIDEIKVSENLKRDTIKKITKKENNMRRYSVLASTLVIFVIAISIAIPVSIDKNRIDPLEIAQVNNGLPKLENFEELYDILKEREDNYYELNSGAILESGSMDSITAGKENITTDSTVKNESDYSKTNTQVEGVDEADIAKTDGNYIYYISSDKIVIVNTENSSKLQLVSEIEFNSKVNFNPQEIYIYENKLVVIGQKNNYYYRELIAVDSVYPTTNEAITIAKIYNIENKRKPKLEREVEIEGDYLTSRMIGEELYFITNKYLYSYLLKNKELDEIDENQFKPKYKDTVLGNEQKYIEFNDISYFPESEDTSYLNVVGLNVNNNEKANIETYLGAGTEIYSSQDNLYITRVKYEYKDSKTYGYYNNYDVNTYIYKFKLENSKATYINAGSVPGEVLNQFSMDEKDGYFRIATTDFKNWNSETNTNNLYVLNNNLELVGKIEGLAKEEKIYSVRFMGNRAYMVTFVETDPLFVIDLAEPTNPKVLGELKIPGYSKYLHPYDETHIIGFGENTRTNEYGGVVTDGMKMALFDVSNPNEPKELYSVDIGERGTYSEILNNHKALLFSKEKNIIAFPISISEETGNYRTNLKFQGAIVYGLDLEKGFTLKGQIAHMQIDDGYTDYDYEKAVERIIYINENLYTLSQKLIKSTDINTMKEQDTLKLIKEESSELKTPVDIY